ncbi:ABC transporter permease [Blautia massiliensis (ex Durand et al. 2017)]|uniref:ABC transporter permease n=1 Tax=Blautia TaxID=572511 RepID=UPI0003FE45D9|nr:MULTISPECIES: ABC transporter permease [Blautia]UEA29143.1 ABC transporter permease [Blautia massiliensis (ex Durand et al. 2017)]UWO17537.1 ABC transporter permease [Blautia sp. KLE_1732_HM_1032]
MFFLNRAFKYIVRKKSRTCILILVLIVVNILNITMLTIRKNTSSLQNEIKQDTQSKIVIEKKNNCDISAEDVYYVEQNSEVTSINKISLQYAYPNNFNNFKGKIEDNSREKMVTLYGYDDLSKDSRFAELEMKLMKGELISSKSKNEIVVNQKLAEENSLGIGDKLVFENAGKIVEGTICGIYESSVQDKQPDTMISFYRIENIIFVSQDIVHELNNKDVYSKIVLYLAEPEKIKDVEQQMMDYFGENAEVSISDSMYQKVQMQLQQLERISNLVLWGITLITFAVITLLYCIWIRDRKKEIGVFLSLGYTKRNIFFQVFTESEILLFISVIVGLFLSGKIANLIMNIFNDAQVSRINLDTTINFKVACQVFAFGTGIILVAILIATLSLFLKKPREILAEMED